MSIVRGEITINERVILELDVNPNFGSGAPAPVGSIAQVDLTKSWWLKTGVSDTAWELQFDPNQNNSQKVVYNVDGTPNYIEFFNSLTQITANRIARYDFVYNIVGDLASDSLKLYLQNGTSVVITLTSTYTYTGIDLTSIGKVFS